MCISACLYVYHPFQLLNKLIDFHEMWYEHHATRGHPNLVLFNFLLSGIAAWQTHELAQCDTSTT